MDQLNFTSSDVIVVDSQPEAYAEVFADVAHWNLCVEYFALGDEAIRNASRLLSKLWLINTQLPDMSGIDLLTLVRDRNPSANIFLVGDSYNPEDELLSRISGPTAYVCKPPHLSWLSGLRPEVRTIPICEAETETEFMQASEHY